MYATACTHVTCTLKCIDYIIVYMCEVHIMYTSSSSAALSSRLN